MGDSSDQGGEAMSVSHVSRGCAFGDFDNDGGFDILVINLNELPSPLRNDFFSEFRAQDQADLHFQPRSDRGPRDCEGWCVHSDPGAAEPGQLLVLR